VYANYSGEQLPLSEYLHVVMYNQQ